MEEKPENVLNEHSEEGYTVWVTKAEGEKCARCWKYRKLNADGICEECADAIEQRKLNIFDSSNICHSESLEYQHERLVNA